MDDFEETEYQCTLCFEILFYPVLLPCKHCFCKICLDKHVDNNSFSCPLCRARLSNWLRQLKNKNLNIVDIKLWETIQERFPKQVESRRKGESSCQTLSDDASFNNQSAAVLSCKVHKEAADTLRKTEEDWRGWPSPCVSSCSDVIRQILALKQRPTRIQPRLSNPGEINQEYKKFMEEQEIHRRKMEEIQFKMSEALIKKIEEEERSEIEQLNKVKEAQMKADEEVAKQILEEENNFTNQSINGMLKASTIPKRRQFVKKKDEERSEIEQLKKVKEAQLKADEEVAILISEEESNSTNQSIIGMLKASTIPKRRQIVKKKDEERSEVEQLKKVKEAQLKADEEVAILISEEESNSTNQSIIGMLKASTIPKRRQFVKKKVSLSSEMTDETNSSSYKDSDEFERKVFGQIDSPLFLGPASPKSFPNSSQRRKMMFTSSSPIPLDKPSTSKDDIFSKYFLSPPENQRTSNSSQKTSLQNSPPRPSFVPNMEDVVSSTTISNKELSHFATVDPGPSTSSGAGVCEKQVSQSRCSSGADSIGQELHHFKPIRSSPTTPPKEGCEWVPQVVVAQRGTVSSEVAQALSTSDLNLSTEEIEESVKYHKQLEDDLQLAFKLQKEWDAEENKKRTLERSDYNLRKRKKSNLRKKVLLDRTQSTLDSMLIK